MTKLISFFACLLLISQVAAQTTTPQPDSTSEPVQNYPITNTIVNSALKTWAEDFPNKNVGLLHVYTDPLVDPNEVYLMRGEEISSVSKALLPKKFQRMARRMNATLYGSAAIAGTNENLYLLRMDGMMSDRIEMFAIRGNKIKHLKTLAFRKCADGLCAQMDSYITDVDGDGIFDLIQIKRIQNRSGERVAKPKAFVMKNRKRTWKRTRNLDLPLNSLEFFDPSTDQQ